MPTQNAQAAVHRRRERALSRQRERERVKVRERTTGIDREREKIASEERESVRESERTREFPAELIVYIYFALKIKTKSTTIAIDLRNVKYLIMITMRFC